MAPVGVGKCLRPINGKTITGLLKEDIIRTVAGNTADMCRTGIRHRSSNTCCKVKLRRGNSECLMLVDADSAFNKLNIKVSLENIKRLCPPLYTKVKIVALLPAEFMSGCELRLKISNCQGVTK